MHGIRFGGLMLSAVLLAGLAVTPAVAATPPAGRSSSASVVLNGPSVQDHTGTFRFSADSAAVERGGTLALSVTYTKETSTPRVLLR